MADKGIRDEAIRKFMADLPTRPVPGTRLDNRNFRANINTHLMENFGIPIHSAATAYNHAFRHAKELAKTNAEVAAQLVGLGRPEDKKGGRKKKVVAPAAATPETTPGDGAASDVLQSNILGNGDGDDDKTDEAPPAAKVIVVQKNGKGTPKEFDTREQAEEYIAANTGQFKPALIIQE